MITTQDVIERSIYTEILNVMVAMGLTLNPADYLPISVENSERFNTDKDAMSKFYYLYGAGNNQSKDKKESPRIVIIPQGFYPGSIGLPKPVINKIETGVGWTSHDEPYETLDAYVDIHVVSNTQEENRILQSVLFRSIPQRGYIKPYDEEAFLFTGNIFLELLNYYNRNSDDYGIIEKVYQFIVKDIPLGEIETENDLVPIQDISVLLQQGDDGPERQLIEIP